MVGMYGADVEQLRALARSFDTAANTLDHDRMSVGNAIRIQAWVGPVAVRFRAEWDSAHSAKVAGAARRLHAAAESLRKNADDQERTSQANGANPGGVLPPGFPIPSEFLRAWGRVGLAAPGVTLGSLLSEFSDGTIRMVKGIVGVTEVPQAVVEMGHSVARDLLAGKGADTWKHFGDVAEKTKLGKILGAAGTTLGLISTGFGAYETVTRALEGDTQGAIYSGIKTLIGAAAVIPSPVQPLFAAASIGIAVGEMLSNNPVVTKAVTDVVVGAGEAIGRGVSNAVQTIDKIGDGVGKATGNFLGGIGKAAKRLWPW